MVVVADNRSSRRMPGSVPGHIAGIVAGMLAALMIAALMLAAATAPPAFAEAADSIVVCVPTDRCPMFYEDAETGEVTGIGVDLMRIASDEAGFGVEFVPMAEPTLKDALDNEAYDVVMPLGSPIKSASGQASVVSEDLMQTPFALVTDGDRKGLPPLDELRVGMLESLGGGAETVRQLYPGIEISFYKTMPECVSALRSGEVDALLHNSYVWSYVLQKPSYSDLRIQPLAVFSMDFQAGAPDTPEGREAIARINEGIARLDDTQRQAVVLDHTSRRLYRYELDDYVHDYGLPMALAVLLAVALVALAVIRHRAVRLRHEAHVRDLRDHDELTGVLSHGGFRRRVWELLAENPDVPYMIAYSNIRNFKYVNETLGREAGDGLLRFWADTLRGFVTEKGCIGRLESDHFVILHTIDSEARVSSDEADIVDLVREYFVRQGGGNRLQVCSGVYILAPDDYRDPDIDRMIDFAREAAGHAQDDKGDGYAFYNIEQWEHGKKAADVVGHLPIAIEHGEIQVWYQPQVDGTTGRVTGAEALCRWEHPKLGWLSPAEFIPMLEEANLVYTLDRYIWTRVCRDLQRWNSWGRRRVVSVNVSRHDIEANPVLPHYFYDLTQAHGVDPSQLRIEITESAYADHPELLVQATSEFQSYGFQVEMDDFGSGYSSLNMLKEILVDRVKLDLRFLTEAGDPERGRIIVSHVIRMVDELGMGLIAEGVETDEQADFLLERGCPEMQGYRFHKPMSVADFEALDEASETETGEE